MRVIPPWKVTEPTPEKPKSRYSGLLDALISAKGTGKVVELEFNPDDYEAKTHNMSGLWLLMRRRFQSAGVPLPSVHARWESPTKCQMWLGEIAPGVSKSHRHSSTALASMGAPQEPDRSGLEDR